MLPLLLLACLSSPDDTAGGDADTADTAAAAADVGDPCAYVDDATLQTLTGGPYTVQDVAYPTGEAMCLWATDNPPDGAHVGGVQLLVSPRGDDYETRFVADSYTDMLAATPAPADSVHPAVDGADDSYVLVYAASADRGPEFDALAVTPGLVLALNGFTRVADGDRALDLAVGVTQAAVDYAGQR
jgi:hypothetical protein